MQISFISGNTGWFWFWSFLRKPSIENLTGNNCSNGAHQSTFHLPFDNFLSLFTALKMFYAEKITFFCCGTRFNNMPNFLHKHSKYWNNFFIACVIPKCLSNKSNPHGRSKKTARKMYFLSLGRAEQNHNKTPINATDFQFWLIFHPGVCKIRLAQNYLRKMPFKSTQC